MLELKTFFSTLKPGTEVAMNRLVYFLRYICNIFFEFGRQDPLPVQCTDGDGIQDVRHDTSLLSTEVTPAPDPQVPVLDTGDDGNRDSLLGIQTHLEVTPALDHLNGRHGTVSENGRLINRATD